MLTLNTGIYVISGSFSTSGNGGVRVVPNGEVLLYFACSNYPTRCKTSGTPATFSATGNNGVTLTPMSSGVYAGVAIFFDPDSTGTIDWGKGGTLTVGGSVYAPSGVLTMHGGNGAAEVDGRLILGSLNIDNSAQPGFIRPIGGGLYCTVHDDSVSGTPSGSTTSYPGHVVFEIACGGGSGIIDFNYGN
ncbi:MAG: hypothetical protein E6J14_10805 [Chloroflexi bacterium]|nr:MAG: hypothetical protein E6J14_10805 [Chloroflexota bacterium]